MKEVQCLLCPTRFHAKSAEVEYLDDTGLESNFGICSRCRKYMQLGERVEKFVAINNPDNTSYREKYATEHQDHDRTRKELHDLIVFLATCRTSRRIQSYVDLLKQRIGFGGLDTKPRK